MFGYVRIQKSELLVREYEAYKSVYCGLCKQLGKDYSILSRFILSYDCTFYAIVVMSLRRSCSGFERRCCRFNPLKRCSFCKCEDDAVSKAAALSVILAYYKLIDNIKDGSFFRRLGCRILKPLFSRWRKKAARRFPEFDEYAAGMMEEQAAAEQNPDCTLDMAADPSATMLGEVLRFEATDKAQERIFYQMGYGLGRFIYLADAIDDYKDDIKSGNFNPFNSIKENIFDVMSNNLSQAAASVFDAYNLLELTDFRGIIDNVILKGLPTVQAELMEKVKVYDEGSV